MRTGLPSSTGSSSVSGAHQVYSVRPSSFTRYDVLDFLRGTPAEFDGDGRLVGFGLTLRPGDRRTGGFVDRNASRGADRAGR